MLERADMLVEGNHSKVAHEMLLAGARPTRLFAASDEGFFNPWRGRIRAKASVLRR